MFRFFRKSREAVKKYLLIFFLSIVSIGMVITLAPIPTGDTSRMETNVLAEIGGQSITTQDLLRNVQARTRNLPISDNPRLMASLATAVLDDLILRRALWSEAKKLGIQVPDSELRQALQSIPWLYPNGAFVGMERYQDAIQQQTGMTVAQFEAQFRDSLLFEKMRAVIGDGVQVAPAEVQGEFLQRNAKAKIEYVVFDPSQFLKAVEISSPALEAFFKQDPGRYKVPEQRRVLYLLIDQDHVRAQAKVSEDEVKRYYGQHLSEYRVEDRAKVAHILFKTDGKSPAEVAAIEKTAQDILARIKSGADFGEPAKKYSEDSSASKGGELGWIVRGQAVKEFEAAAFSLKPGQVSDLIRTTYGIHIVKVLDRQSAHLQTFEEVKETIRAEIEKQKVAAAQQALTAEVERQLRASPQEFPAVARKFGLEAKETLPFRFNQTLPDFGTSESFANLSFQLRQGEIGMPFAVPKGLAIIQVIEINPEHPPKLEEVRAQVEQDYRAEQAKDLALEKAKAFAVKCQTGDFGKLAQASGYPVKDSNDFTQQDYVEGLGSGSQLADAFSLGPGKTSTAVALGGNNVVFRVLSHLPANEADFPSQKEQIAEQLLERKRALAFELYQQNLKQQLLRSGELKMNDAGMKQFLAAYEKS